MAILGGDTAAVCAVAFVDIGTPKGAFVQPRTEPLLGHVASHVFQHVGLQLNIEVCSKAYQRRGSSEGKVQFGGVCWLVIEAFERSCCPGVFAVAAGDWAGARAFQNPKSCVPRLLNDQERT